MSRTEPESVRLEDVQRLKEHVERDGSPVIYLHGGPDQPSFGMLIVDERMREVAEKALEENGWQWYQHSHIDGDV